ncbi:MAG: hypothetical protein O7J95_09880 [Planctomycetota bacterium]|nr:hypothetical protein [Planctomycetota bacterium]
MRARYRMSGATALLGGCAARTLHFASEVPGRWEREAEWVEEHLLAVARRPPELVEPLAGRAAGVSREPRGRGSTAGRPREAVRRPLEPLERPVVRHGPFDERDFAALEPAGPLDAFGEFPSEPPDSPSDEEEVRRAGEREWSRRGF